MFRKQISSGVGCGALCIAFLVSYAPSTPAQEIRFREVSATHLPRVANRPVNSMDVKLVDIDKDGDIDIVIPVEFVKNMILLNDGNGRFTDGSHLIPDKIPTENPKPWPYYPYHDSEEVAIADFDGDGHLDLFFASEDDKISELYFNNGDGSFRDASKTIPVQGVSNAVVAADFDGDGLIDIILGNNGQDHFLRNTGKGVFVDETAARLPASDDITQDIAVADFDKDGHLDLLIGNEDRNKLYRNNGKGVFEDVTDRYFSDGLEEETRGATWVDVNGDGWLDIFFANVYMFQKIRPVQRLLIYNPQTGKYEDQTRERLPIEPGISIIDAAFADIDNDGDVDLVLAGTDQPRIYFNDGSGKFEDKSEAIFGNRQFMAVAVAVADLNKDGKPDIYFANFRNGDMLFLQEK